jgi:hypothetical protein
MIREERDFKAVGAVPVSIESRLSDPLMTGVLEAAQKAIEDAGLASRYYIGSVEISEIPGDVLTESKAVGCGYRLVCYGADRYSDWYTDAQGQRWRRDYTRLKCRMLPGPLRGQETGHG